MALPTNIATPTPSQAAPSNVQIPTYDVELNVGYGITFPDGSATDPSVGFAEDADGTGTGFYKAAANTIGVVANGAAVAQFSASGLKIMGGGAVTQATSKSTGVTLSKATGQITMDAASLAAATVVSFTLTNTLIAATDVLILNHISGGTAGAYTLNAQCAAGSASINVRNATAGALAEAIVIQFVLIKGATS